MTKEKAGAVIAAGGSSQRMGGLDKLFAPLAGKPVIFRVIETFQRCDAIDRIVLVLNHDNITRYQKLAAGERWAKAVEVCPGGERRQDSVAAGLSHLKDCKWVVTHDGARPLATVELIERGLEAARETGAAAAAVPVKDTIKIAGSDMLVQDTPLRESLWAVQTPQVFRFDIIAEAYLHVKNDVTDDASLVEKLGYSVKLYTGSYDNIKITTPDDLVVAEALLKKHAG